MATSETLILGFPEYAEPARRMAAASGVNFAEVAIHRFPDGESLVRLPETLPPHVVFCRSLDHPNSKLIELELAAAAALELGVERLTLVAPYLCYMRQDRAFHDGEAVSQRIIGRLLARHFDAVITVDPHLHRTHDLRAAVPVRRAVSLSAATVMVQWLEALGEKPILLGPDAESGQWVNAIAAPVGLDHGVANKTRLGDRSVSVELPELNFRSRAVVMVDDVASTGRTLAECAQQLQAQGAGPITALVTHALFVDDALDVMQRAGIGTIVSTDSIPHASNGMSLDAILASALFD
jgi:ribose-phosphate pyrophosphokinase